MASKVVEMQKLSGTRITQRELAEYRYLRREFREASYKLRMMRDVLTYQLREGTCVEDGLNEAELITIKRGSKSFTRLVVR